MSLDKARAAIVQAYIDAGLNLPTFYENKPGDPPANPWAIFTFIPNNPEVVTLGSGGDDEATGFVQIDLNYTLNSGDKAAADAFNLLRDKFIAGQIFTYSGQAVRVGSCGRSHGRNVNGWYRVSITIYWSARIRRKEII